MARFAKGTNALMISDRSCAAFPYREMVQEWNGFWVHTSEFESKQPQLLTYYHQADAWMGYWLGETGEPALECLSGSTTLHCHVPQVGLNTNHDRDDTYRYFDLIREFQRGNHLYVRDGSRNEL